MSDHVTPRAPKATEAAAASTRATAMRMSAMARTDHDRVRLDSADGGAGMAGGSMGGAERMLMVRPE